MNDIPQTNASSIVANVEEVFSDDSNVFTYAKPSSFYESLFPPNSIDIFLAFNAL